ncbi:hypothetical protein [Rhodoplanes azumiensis]|uniref:Glycosyltransferase RgtA/B/C/D-like domain-containing protein n=1 Tax=Rhodoplanes azumiensis TaxID=1897628 RepID=A0ABW5AHA6_9BRAD
MRSAERRGAFGLSLAVPAAALAPSRAACFAPQIAVALIALAGFGLTLAVFWPGVMTYDARYVLVAARAGVYGDWQSPVMAWAWRQIDLLVPGPPGMLLVTAALYWSGFSIVGAVLARRAPWLGVVTVLLGFAPPGFMFLGIIWRDILFGCVWLLAAALAFASAFTSPQRGEVGPRSGPGEGVPSQPTGAVNPHPGRVLRPRPTLSLRERGGGLRIGLQVASLALIVLGVLLRPNAMLAAPVLVAYALWPAQFHLKRLALLFIPTGVALFVLLQLVYYGALGAKREFPQHSLAVFDLGGITHFSGEVRLPGDWTPEQRRRLVSDCYDPYLWDAYWYGRPCAFVMDRLEKRDGVFGTPALTAAWSAAIMAHPLAWLRHRLAFTTQFLVEPNFTIWVLDLDDKSRRALPDDRAFGAMLAVHDVLKPTPLFRAGVWLAACVVIAGFAWRYRGTPCGAFALVVPGSAIVYVASFALLGVAADFRYAWWAVPAALTGVSALLAVPRPRPAVSSAG